MKTLTLSILAVILTVNTQAQNASYELLAKTRYNYGQSITEKFIDVNNDNHLDIIKSATDYSTGDSVFYFSNDKNMNFEDSLLLDVGVRGVAFTDIDKNGSPDYVGFDQNNIFYKLNSNGVFDQKNTLKTGLNNLSSVYFTDFDNDNVADLFYLERKGESYKAGKDSCILYFLKGDGNSGYNNPQSIDTISFYNSTYGTDNISDVKIEAITKMSSNGNYHVFYSLTNWLEQIIAKEINPNGLNKQLTGTGFGLATVQDLNDDGFKDYAIDTSVYLNDQNDQFSLAPKYSLAQLIKDAKTNLNFENNYFSAFKFHKAQNGDLYAFGLNFIAQYDNQLGKMVNLNKTTTNYPQGLCYGYSTTIEEDSIRTIQFVDIDNDGREEIYFTTGYSCEGEYIYTLSTLNSAEKLNKISFEMYPNPTNGNFTLNTNGETIDIEILDNQGRIMKNILNFSSGQISIDDVTSGLYFVVIKKDNSIYTEQLIVK